MVDLPRQLAPHHDPPGRQQWPRSHRSGCMALSLTSVYTVFTTAYPLDNTRRYPCWRRLDLDFGDGDFGHRSGRVPFITRLADARWATILGERRIGLTSK